MKLLGQRYNGAILEQDYLHTGADGNDRITTKLTEDVAPVFESAKRQAQARPMKDFRFVCEIPETVMTETAKACAKTWGIKAHEALGEIVHSKTDRAKGVLKMLKTSRDLRKFQAKHYS